MVQSTSCTNVLLVDDNPANLLALEAMLGDLGHNLVRASSGREALQLLEGEDFAVVLLDVQMQEIDGFETAERIRERERSRRTPIIFLTAYDDHRLSVEQAYALGAVDYLVKPLIPAVLRAKVAVFIDLFQKTEQLRLSERDRFRAIIEHSYDAVALLDREGIVCFASPSTVRVLGYAPEEFVGRKIFELMHPEDVDRTAALFAGLLQHPGSGATTQYRCRHKNGSWLWIEGAGTNLLDEPSVRAIVANYRDITLEKQASEAKDNFIAMLAHELRNPLSPVLHGLHILRMTPGDAEALNIMERQVKHLARLVEDLLDASRVTRGRIQLRQKRLDLSRLVRTAIEDHRFTAEAAKLTLTVGVPETPVWVMGDETRLSQVFANLLENAIKFTNDGGRIEIALSADPEARRATVSFTDTGMGIDPELLARLFEPFCQADQSLDRSKGGLGLGLAIIKGLTELHRGHVEARSRGPGQGAEFLVMLPMEAEPAAITDMPKSPTTLANARRVLVIEDNRAAAETLRTLLELLGHVVRVAYDGVKGVTAAGEWRPDIILSDIGLPGLDGYGVAREVRRNPHIAETKLIAVTGYDDPKDRQHALESGFDYVITKPAEPAMLIELLANGA